ncbi:MAG: hypothetical protein LUD02_09175 [Tannerellaceae bacterium]|nr:hypothetical protein [Tannerellaceae bacterium]
MKLNQQFKMSGILGCLTFCASFLAVAGVQAAEEAQQKNTGGLCKSLYG